MKLMGKLFSKKEKVTIDFCENNLDRFYSDNDFTKFSSFLDNQTIVYKEYSCQSKCKECKKSPYAIINGEMIAAESPAQLLEMMKQIVTDK